jgi:hypothetical protein
LSAAASVASLIQNVTVPVALTPKLEAGVNFAFVSADAVETPVMDTMVAIATTGTTNLRYLGFIAVYSSLERIERPLGLRLLGRRAAGLKRALL